MDSQLSLSGLHHITAVTGRAPQNAAFYRQVLGLRLVKKTVNQDDVRAYHLFYGDELGRAGTEMTFFDWPHAGPVQRGAGTVSESELRVPPGTLGAWEARLREAGVTAGAIEEREGRATLAFCDPEEQRLRLVESDASGPAAWAGSPVAPALQIRGLSGVTLQVRRLEPTARVLSDVLGFRVVSQSDESEGRVTLFETGEGGPGAQVRVLETPDAPRGRAGIGGVHHVAFRTPDDATQRAWHERIAGAGLRVSPLVDRFYFQSLYFPEPSGVLFEIATDGPGFATDEDAAHLGETLSLPPFLESQRAHIEAGLQPLDTSDGAAP